MNLFDINNALFTVFGAPMSLLELLAVLTGFIAVYLASQGKVINFYIGLTNNVLYFLFFYQCHLYSMMLLQGVYFCISSYGIYSWRKKDDLHETLKISSLSWKHRGALTIIIILVGLCWGYGVSYFSQLFPQYIEQPAYPYVDALLTMASVFGQILLTRKKIDNWAIWLIVDSISIILYSVMGLYFTTLLYVIYWIIAFHAYCEWHRTMQQESLPEVQQP